MKLCTEETTQDELRTIIQTVNLQEQGKVNWVFSMINDPTILNVDASRTPKSNRTTLEVDGIPQAQIEDSIFGKVYSFIKADKQPTTSERARESTDTLSIALLILGSNFNSTVRVEITPFWGVKKIEYISLQNQG